MKICWDNLNEIKYINGNWRRKDNILYYKDSCNVRANYNREYWEKLYKKII